MNVPVTGEPWPLADARLGSPPAPLSLLTCGVRLRTLLPTMNARVRETPIAAVLIAAFGAMSWIATARAAPSDFDPSPRDGVLLLRNGETMQGKVTRTGDHYFVAVPNGEIRVKAGDVEFVCDTLEEGYLRKRSFIRLGTAQEHLQLGEWCQRHGLVEHAQRELAEAEAIEPRHPMIAVLRRRLEIAQRPAQQPQRATEGVENASIGPEDLDRLIRGLPPHSVETFTQDVQPVLMNHCIAAGCHGADSTSKYRLLRAPAGRPASRRLTQRNLHATLQWVDQTNPTASPLLTAPMQPHGPAKTPVFSKGQADQYQRIAVWVHQLTRTPEASPSAQVQPQKGHLSQAMPTPAALAAGAAGQPAGSTAKPAADDASPFDGGGFAPTDGGERGPDGPQGGRNDALHRPEVKRGNPFPGFVPADPFDPEIFNRRYAPQGEGPPAKSDGADPGKRG